MIAVFVANREDLLALSAAVRARNAQVRVAHACLGERLPGGVAAGR